MNPKNDVFNAAWLSVLNENSQSIEGARDAYKMRLMHLENIGKAILADRQANISNTITNTTAPSALHLHLQSMEKSGMPANEIMDLRAEAERRMQEHPRNGGILLDLRKKYHSLDNTGQKLDIKA